MATARHYGTFCPPRNASQIFLKKANKALTGFGGFPKNTKHAIKNTDLQPRLIPMKTKTLLNRVDTRLAACAAAAAGAALAAPPAEATIIWSGPVNIGIPSTTAGVYLNVVTGVNGPTPASAPGWDLNPWGSTNLSIWANNAASPSDGVVINFTGGSSATLSDNLPVGTLVDGTWTFGRTSGIETTGATAFTLSSSNNYFGFRFLNEGTGQINFGWAQLTLAGTYQGQPRAIISYAYEDSGAGILVGAVPEPSTFALLGVMAAGAFGVREWRKRKAA